MKIDKKVIKELSDYLDEFNLTEIEITEKDTKIKVSKNTVSINSQPQVVSSVTSSNKEISSVFLRTKKLIVSDVDDEAPTFASANTFTAAENQTPIGYVIASDVDTDDSNITFSVSGDSRVTIESAGNGAITSGGTAALLRFTATLDNENYTTAVVTVTATDLA